MIELLTNPQTWIAFATLTLLELVLGIDNIIFISILVDKLPKARREFARRLGLFMAMFMRIGLLLVLAWIVGLVTPLFSVFGMEISGRDLILILGGLFLIWKSTTEIHQSHGRRRRPHDQRREGHVYLGHPADHGHRPGVFARLDHHRGGHGGRRARDDRRGDRLGRADDAVCRADRPLRVGPPDHQDAGAVLPGRGRRGAGGRGLRLPRAQGLCLLRHGVLAECRDAQHPHAQAQRDAR